LKIEDGIIKRRYICAAKSRYYRCACDQRDCYNNKSYTCWQSFLTFRLYLFNT